MKKNKRANTKALTRKVSPTQGQTLVGAVAKRKHRTAGPALRRQRTPVVELGLCAEPSRSGWWLLAVPSSSGHVCLRLMWCVCFGTGEWMASKDKTASFYRCSTLGGVWAGPIELNGALARNLKLPAQSGPGCAAQGPCAPASAPAGGSPPARDRH